MAGKKKEPWRGRCQAIKRDGTPCGGATLRDREHCPHHADALAGELDRSVDDVALTLTVPGLGNRLVDLIDVDWLAIRKRAVDVNPDLFVPRRERDLTGGDKHLEDLGMNQRNAGSSPTCVFD